MEDIDIWRLAKTMIDAHGDGAGAEAARRLGTFQAAGDRKVASDWGRVHRAILRLQALPPAGAKPN